MGIGEMGMEKTYKVKEIFGPTIQGEGGLIGQVVVFLRLSGCNQWDGRPETRAASQCPFCDTDFLGGDRMTADEIGQKLDDMDTAARWVVISGGEPMLQLDQGLVDNLHDRGWQINVETNGTVYKPLLHSIDHISFSPKTGLEEIEIEWCDSIKLLYPNDHIEIEDYLEFPAREKFIQPVFSDSHQIDMKAVDYLLNLGGEWRLSPQLHKLIGVE